MTLNIKKYLKTGTLISLCAATALCTAACKNPFSSSDDSTTENNTVTEEHSVSDTEPTDTKEDSGKTSAEDSSDKAKDENTDNNTAAKPENTERTPETDRQEIQNNIRDAEELIDNDMIDDARAVIRTLRSRDLTESEKAQVDNLEKRLLSVSD